MSNSFVKHEDVQNLLRISAGLNTTDGDERFKSIMHRLLENICTLIDDYNITQEEFWQAINYLHELGGRQEAALLAAGLGLEHYLDLRQTPSMRRNSVKRARRVPSKAHCMSLTRLCQRAMPVWMMVRTPGK